LRKICKKKTFSMEILQWLGFKHRNIRPIFSMDSNQVFRLDPTVLHLSAETSLFNSKTEYTIKHFNSPRQFVLNPRYCYLSWAFSPCSQFILSKTWINWRFSSDVTLVIASFLAMYWFIWALY
jgi:hypothetical protein